MDTYKELCDAHDRIIGSAHASVLEHLQQKGLFQIRLSYSPIPFDQTILSGDRYSTVDTINVHGEIVRRDGFGVDIDDSDRPRTIKDLGMEASLTLLEHVEKGYYEILVGTQPEHE